jgi:TPR repeat protein
MKILNLTSALLLSFITASTWASHRTDYPSIEEEPTAPKPRAVTQFDQSVRNQWNALSSSSSQTTTTTSTMLQNQEEVDFSQKPESLPDFILQKYAEVHGCLEAVKKAISSVPQVNPVNIYPLIVDQQKTLNGDKVVQMINLSRESDPVSSAAVFPPQQTVSLLPSSTQTVTTPQYFQPIWLEDADLAKVDHLRAKNKAMEEKAIEGDTDARKEYIDYAIARDWDHSEVDTTHSRKNVRIFGGAPIPELIGRLTDGELLFLITRCLVHLDDSIKECIYKRINKPDGKSKIAAYSLGLCYLEGIGTPCSNADYDWFMEAANNGHPAAEYLLALYDQKDASQMLWLKKSAQHGYAQAQYELGLHYTLHMDIGNAIFWLRKAAIQDHLYAQNELGICYSRSDVPQNVTLAYEWLRRAAEKGHGPSQKHIRDLEESGRSLNLAEINAIGYSYGLAFDVEIAKRDPQKKTKRSLPNPEEEGSPTKKARVEKGSPVKKTRAEKESSHTKS